MSSSTGGSSASGPPDGSAGGANRARPAAASPTSMSTTPDAAPRAAAAAGDENALIAERRDKLAAIRARGVAFPNDFKPKDRAGELARRHGHLDNAALEPQAVAVSVAGRLMLKRVMGKASF